MGFRTVSNLRFGEINVLLLQGNPLILILKSRGKEILTQLTRLSLGNDIVAFDTWKNCSLLNSRGFFETIGINSSQKFLLEVHVIEIVHNLAKNGSLSKICFNISFQILTVVQFVSMTPSGSIPAGPP